MILAHLPVHTQVPSSLLSALMASNSTFRRGDASVQSVTLFSFPMIPSCRCYPSLPFLLGSHCILGVLTWNYLALTGIGASATPNHDLAASKVPNPMAENSPENAILDPAPA